MENNKRCPFLKIQVCGYCSLFPLRKMIPVDQMKTKSMCLSGDYARCSQYTDVSAREQNNAQVVQEESMQSDIRGFIVRKNYFYHYGHTWVRREAVGSVRIGIDGFAGKLLSNIQQMELIAPANTISSGKAFMKIRCGDKTGMLMSPVDGTLSGFNGAVNREPGIVNREPYDRGWLITASIQEHGLKWLLNDELAVKWMEIEAERLHSIVRQDIGITITDGGMIIESLASLVDAEEWKPLMRAFLLNE